MKSKRKLLIIITIIYNITILYYCIILITTARLAEASLITKTDFDTKLVSLNKKINPNKTNHIHVENEFKKLQAFDSIYFRGKSHFEENGTQNYLVF